jgi:hypothetical protein
MQLLHTHDWDPFTYYTCVSELSKRRALKGITFPHSFSLTCNNSTCTSFIVEGFVRIIITCQQFMSESALAILHRSVAFTFSQFLVYLYTMNPSTYSDFTFISVAFGDTPNTWMGRLLVTEIYWFIALFTWIVFTNLDMIEEWLRPSLSVGSISEYVKGQRRIRRLHEISILLLSFGALLFLVQRQDENALSQSPLTGLYPCSSVKGKRFWRCVGARSVSLPERAKAMQQPRSCVGDEVHNRSDVNRDTCDLSNVSYPLLSDPMDMHMASVNTTTGSQSRSHVDDRTYNVSVGDNELVFESIVSYLQWRHDLEPQC